MFQMRHNSSLPTVEPQRKGKLVDLQDYVRILTKHWVTVAVSTLVGLVLAIGFSALMSPQYESTSTLYVSVRTDSGGSDELFQGASFAQTAVTSYVDVATTAIVLEQVRAELDTELSRDELDTMLAVTSPSGSVLINITASHSDPEVAAEIANTTGAVFIDVVENDIEVASEGESGPVQIRIIEPGPVPEDQTSPNVMLNIALGLIVGAAIGIATALIRGLLDTRIHSVADVEQITTTPVVGRIAYDDEISERPLVVHDDPRSPRAEAFRTLRTNLQFLGAGDGSRVFMISSAMPGEGKTHVVANLAIVLAESGARVALIEADLRKPRLAQVMGIEGAAGLSDVLINRATLDDVTQPWGTESLFVLPAGQIPPNPSELLGSRTMEELIAEVSENADYVLIDAPPILPVTDAAVLSAYTSGTLLVTAVSQTKRQAIEHAIESLETVDGPPLGLIVNGLPVKSSDVSGLMSYKYGDVDATSTASVSRQT